VEEIKEHAPGAKVLGTKLMEVRSRNETSQKNLNQNQRKGTMLM
jgi:hypothetical protein